MKKINSFVIKISIFLVLILNSCYYDTYVPPEIDLDPNKIISFSEDIQPIFDQNCSTVGCHQAGNISPNLEKESSYQSLINGKYINTDNPESSELYQWMSGNRSITMPISGINEEFNVYVLAWIEQGAKNN